MCCQHSYTKYKTQQQLGRKLTLSQLKPIQLVTGGQALWTAPPFPSMYFWMGGKGLQNHPYNFPLQSDHTAHHSKGTHCCFSPSPIPTYSRCCSWIHASLLACRNSCSSAKYWSDFSATEEFVSRSPENAKEREKFKALPNLGKQASCKTVKPTKGLKHQNGEWEEHATMSSQRFTAGLGSLTAFIHFGYLTSPLTPFSFAICCLDSHTTATSPFQGSTGHLWPGQGIASDKMRLLSRNLLHRL